VRKVFKKRTRYESTARRSYWQVHMQAWLRSGVTCSEYCRDNRLDRATMMRWIKALEVPVPERRPAPKKQRRKKKQKFSRMPAARTIAFKAFWMMHAEAHRESGLTAVQYANAHRLPAVRMRRESRQFALIVPSQDWRQMLHPSNRPPGSYRSKIRDELRYDLCISPAGGTSDQVAAPPTAQPMRRQYTDKQKLAILADAAERGVTVSMVARRHGVTPPMIFRWRTEFGLAVKKTESATLVTATVIERAGRGRPKKTPLVLENLLPMPAGSVSVEIADGRRVYAPAGCNPDIVRQYIANKESRP
jgi:transposase-like protein